MMTIQYEKFDDSAEFIDVHIGETKETNDPVNNAQHNTGIDTSKLSVENEGNPNTLNNNTSSPNSRQTSVQEQVVIIQGLTKKISKDVYSKENFHFLIENKFPSKLMVESIVFGTLLNVCLLLSQILAMIFKAPYYYIGAGIWSALFMLYIQAVCFNLGKQRLFF